ncbi:hypothetical protein GP486_000741 [Trichoglossum hirsutum]|uniref:Uncharacterized protein n=1 Tax=Trichoglossum hirsutum TaxID=265104 RepID=A0A9P8RTR9_9PEZI|nr:hypothetical protein GP486_000741 [Trichoglossum hirsutum]
MEADVRMGFDIPFDWEIESMYKHFAHWLVTESESSTASVVGIMSSAKFCSTISQFVDPSLAKAFKLLIYATSVLYNEYESFEEQYSAEDLTRFTGYAGDKVVRSLEALLELNALAQSPQRKLGTMFLVLLGTIIATGKQVENIEKAILSDKYQAETKKDELIRLLCHYLVYIGRKSSLLPLGWSEKAAIDLAKSQWDKRPGYTWQFDPANTVEWPCRYEACSSDALTHYGGHGIMRFEEDAGTPSWADLINWPENEDTDSVLNPVQVQVQASPAHKSHSRDEPEEETHDGVEEQRGNPPVDNPPKPGNQGGQNQAQAPERNDAPAEDTSSLPNPTPQNLPDQFQMPEMIYKTCLRCAQVVSVIVTAIFGSIS